MRNKLKILSLSLLLGAFGLASCDTVHFALEEKVQSEAIFDVGTEKIPHNEIQELFEEVVPGNSTTASKVLESLLLKLAKSYFGDFYGKGGIRALATSGNEADIISFINSHSRFQVLDESGSRNNEKEVDNFLNFYGHLEEAIQKSFWSNVTNSTYQDRYFFSEKKFYDTQRAAMYQLDEDYGELLEDDAHLTQIDGALDYKNVEEYFGSNLDNYLDVYEDFVERSILPDLYRKILVENYLQRKNYNALGRSHARKVQTISLKNIDSSADATRNLVAKYAEYILEEKILEENIVGVTSDDVKAAKDFKFLSKLYAGLVDVDEDTAEAKIAKHLYEKASWASDTITVHGETVTFFPITTLGKIYKDYKELSNVRWESSSSTDFTGSGAYTKETGLMLKTREVMAKNSATEGWFTSSGLSELPSELRSRLFKVQVANEIDANYDNDFNLITDKAYDYGMYVKGDYYLTPATYGNIEHPYVIFDSSSSSWVLVRVDEAVKGPKLATDANSKASYDYLAGRGLRAGKYSQNEIVWIVSDMIAGSDTYVKAARQEVIEAAKITYHDQDVYDYFKSNFPDLFD